MIRSIFSAVSGLVGAQTAMDVIGNNISNINTYGFKTENIEFGEAFSQTEQEATSTSPIGLTVGLGSTIEGTTTDFSQGAFQETNVPSDVAVSGNGFFQVTTSSNATASATPAGTTLYTRAGNFVLDSSGNLRTTNGYYVQGYTGSTSTTTGFGTTLPYGFTAPADPSTFTGGVIATSKMSNIQIPSTITTDAGGDTEGVVSYSIGGNGAITVTGQAGDSYTIGYLPLASVANEQALSNTGAGFYEPTDASGAATTYAPGSGPTGQVESGELELSNTDVATEFSNMIIMQRGYDANAKVITIGSDMLQTAVNMING